MTHAIFLWILTNVSRMQLPDYDRICSLTILKQGIELKGSLVLTRARVKPIECFQSKTLVSFDILWPGGYVENDVKNVGRTGYKATTADGLPELKVGDTVLFFLRQRKDKVSYVPSSLKFGIIPLRLDPKKKKYYLPSAWSKEKLNMDEAEVKDLFAYLKKLGPPAPIEKKLENRSGRAR